ncbi:hypothetical protein SAMN04488105_12350 [Salipiger thiooxidans]|uniref:Uncharacterized protein n=1 Tax=Salipiger thiooxidans TaxID=282683 RepID=A0A1G7LFE2_9RHOB|nr:hypothetical protein SAMN04488105_12350 [Salipiger thiooxidans]
MGDGARNRREGDGRQTARKDGGRRPGARRGGWQATGGRRSRRGRGRARRRLSHHQFRRRRLPSRQAAPPRGGVSTPTRATVSLRAPCRPPRGESRQRARAWWIAQALEAFARVDAGIVPATPNVARAEEPGSRRRSAASAAQPRTSRATLLLHRLAGRDRARVPARRAADRRAGHRAPLEGGARTAGRPRGRDGGRGMRTAAGAS